LLQTGAERAGYTPADTEVDGLSEGFLKEEKEEAS
jgi:hypothetical protein